MEYYLKAALYSFLYAFFFFADRVYYCLCLVLDMLSCDLGCTIFIPAFDRINDRLMFFQQLRITLFLFQIFNPVAIHLLPQIVKKLDQTLVLITHNIDLAREADRIVRITDGKISEGEEM